MKFSPLLNRIYITVMIMIGKYGDYYDAII